MRINLLNPSNTEGFSWDYAKKLKQTAFVFMEFGILAILAFILLSLVHPQSESFYGYGKYISYANYDLGKPQYHLILNKDKIGIDNKADIYSYGEYRVNDKRVFDAQRDGEEKKYNVKAYKTSIDDKKLDLGLAIAILIFVLGIVFALCTIVLES